MTDRKGTEKEITNTKPTWLQLLAGVLGVSFLFNGPVRIFLLGYMDFTSVLLLVVGAGWFFLAILLVPAARKSLFGMSYEPEEDSMQIIKTRTGPMSQS